MNYTIKPIVCDYAVIDVDTSKIMCICNIRRNAELIADILNADSDRECAYFYGYYKNAKYKIIDKKEGGEDNADIT